MRNTHLLLLRLIMLALLTFTFIDGVLLRLT